MATPAKFWAFWALLSLKSAKAWIFCTWHDSKTFQIHIQNIYKLSYEFFPIISKKKYEKIKVRVWTKDMFSLAHGPRYRSITCSFVLLLLKCSSVCHTLLFQTLSYVNFCQNRRFRTNSTHVWPCDGPTNWRTDKASFWDARMHLKMKIG